MCAEARTSVFPFGTSVRPLSVSPCRVPGLRVEEFPIDRWLSLCCAWRIRSPLAVVVTSPVVPVKTRESTLVARTGCWVVPEPLSSPRRPAPNCALLKTSPTLPQCHRVNHPRFTRWLTTSATVVPESISSPVADSSLRTGRRPLRPQRTPVHAGSIPAVLQHLADCRGS